MELNKNIMYEVQVKILPFRKMEIIQYKSFDIIKSSI